MDGSESPAVPQLVELKALVAAANSGDENALAMLRQLLDANPQIWNNLGDMSRHVETTLTRLISGSDTLLTESLVRKIADLRSSLSRSGAAAQENLAVDRVVTTWLALHHAEVNSTRSTPGTAQANYWLKRQTQADRSFTAAMRSLASLQKLIPGAASRESVSTPPPKHSGRFASG